MTREQICRQIDDAGIIPAIRTDSVEDAMFAAEAVTRAGIPVIELTTTVPDAPKVIAHLRASHPGTIVGAGTVLDLDSARACIDAGAMFLTSPGIVPELAEVAAAAGIVAIPGALTPSEILQAIRSGADYIKLFPCSLMGGPAYVRALKRPFPHVAFIASGGVNQQNAAEYLIAGVRALGIGQQLIPRRAVRDRKADWIEELARRFTLMVERSRRDRITHFEED